MRLHLVMHILVLALAQSTWMMLAALAVRSTSLTVPEVLLSAVIEVTQKMQEWGVNVRYDLKVPFINEVVLKFRIHQDEFTLRFECYRSKSSHGFWRKNGVVVHTLLWPRVSNIWLLWGSVNFSSHLILSFNYVKNKKFIWTRGE